MINVPNSTNKITQKGGIRAFIDNKIVSNLYLSILIHRKFSMLSRDCIKFDSYICLFIPKKLFIYTHEEAYID